MAAFGGCPAMLGQHQWSTMMLAQGLAPPTFRDPDGRWLGVWRGRLERIEQEGPEASCWQAHPELDDYWLERVLPVERIEVPTFLVGGWRDLFPEAVARAYTRIDAPKQLLFGPWLHVQPDVTAIEPVDWLPLLLRFWDEHLRGAAPVGEPPVRAYVQGAGGWRGAATWPPPGVEEWTLRPAADGFLGNRRDDGADMYEATPIVGTTGGQWDTLGTGMGYPLDQGPDDLLSLTYTTAPLDASVELAGSPEVVLEVERLDDDGPFDLVVKLVDVARDGHANLVTTGWSRGSGGETTIRLWATAWALAPEHSLRLSISCADFPRIWPDPTRPRLRIRRSGSMLRLPVVPGGIGEPFEPPRPAPVAPAERFPWTLDGAPMWTIERDVAHDGVAVTLGGGETMRLPEGGTLALRHRATAHVEGPHPGSASVEGEVTIEVAYPGGERVEVEARSRAWRDRNLCHGRVTLDGRTLLDRSWRNF
jgi:predicted acyl esterase